MSMRDSTFVLVDKVPLHSASCNNLKIKHGTRSLKIFAYLWLVSFRGYRQQHRFLSGNRSSKPNYGLLCSHLSPSDDGDSLAPAWLGGLQLLG